MIPRLDFRRVVQRLIRRGVYAARDRRIRPLPGAGVVLSRLPDTHKAAAQFMVDPVMIASRAYLRADAPDYAGCDPLLVEFAQACVAELRERKLPFYVHEALRSREHQNALHKQGLSKARWGQSAHNFGMAVDIVHFGRYWDLTQKEWAVIGLIGMEVARKRQIKVIWGGDWSFYDPAHWELADWRYRKEIPLEERVNRHKVRDQTLRRLIKRA